jgi:5-(carboxyamino)imidazole ribonucleotide synthase
LKVGILGGGQLARMLVTAGNEMGFDMHVLCANIAEPAAQVCTHVRIGRTDSEADVNEFLKDVDIVTVESEFINTGMINKVIGKIPFMPSVNLLETIQDRLTQKELLKKFNIPTSPFLAWNGEKSNEELRQHFKNGFVVKKRRFGYDGYGTFVVRKNDPMPSLKRDPFGYIVEEFVPFRRELAFSIARNEQDEFAVFPLVESFQVNSRCFWVKGPTKHSKFSGIVAKFKKLMCKTQYCGILAIEMFEHKGRLLVNELAPRVHNSAHYSMDALDLSQFEAHLRGILGLPLRNPLALCKGFAMVNLLGDDKSSSEVHLAREPVGRLHWYGKSELRPGRKMGHINAFGKSPDVALKLALKWRKGFRL